MNTLGQLPPELITCIVQHITDTKDLYACALINQQFNQATTPLLWRSIVFENDPNVANIVNKTSTINETNDIIASRLLMKLALAPHSPGQYLRTLNLTGFPWTDHSVLIVMKHASLLEELILCNGKNITDASFQHLPRHCPNLKTLNLGAITITQASIIALGQHCHQLSKLALIQGTQLPSNTFSALAHLEHLTELELTLFEPESTPDLTLLRRLTHLSLHYTPVADIFDIVVQYKNKNGVCPWPHLTSVSLSMTECLDEDLIGFICACSGDSGGCLRYLCLLSMEIRDDLLLEIADAQPELVEIDLTYNEAVSHWGIRQLIRDCPKLTNIIIDNCILDEADFPEAGPACLDDDDSKEHVVSPPRNKWLYRLDQDAIEKIRLAPIVDFDDDDDDHSMADTDDVDSLTYTDNYDHSDDDAFETSTDTDDYDHSDDDHHSD